MKAPFFQENRKRYFDVIADNSLTLLYSGRIKQKSNDQDYPFEVDKNFYYLTGINQDNVIFAFEKCGNDCREILFVEKNDPIMSKWVGAKLTVEEAQAQSGIKDIRYLDTFDSYRFNIFNSTRANSSRIGMIYLNLDRRNMPGYTNWALDFAKLNQQKYPEIKISNARDLIVGLRMIKSDKEISAIKKAINVTKNGIEAILRGARPNMYEYQLDACFDFSLKNQGNFKLAFDTIVAAGANATILHYTKKSALIPKNQLVLLDLGARYGFYTSDISRTFPVTGRFTERQREIYSEVLSVNKKCIEYLRPGLTWSEFNRYSRKLLYAGLQRLQLVEKEEDLGKYYYHSIGHFIGLDTHDPGLYNMVLKPGMVLTVEPGLYIEAEGIGVRIEDDVLITENGAENFSAEIIKESDDIERFMITVK